MKRIFDILFSLLLLVLSSPLILIISITLKIIMGSPILFKQSRPGLNGMPFTIYKLRTMVNKKDQSGELLPDVERLTPLGRILRRFSLDEIPQLYNVLKGDLSMVGPRPLLMEYLPLYTPEQARRHEMKPGITGWAQVNGRNATSWEERFNMDVWYVDNQSFWLDLKILCLTFFKVIGRTGISQDGHVTMEKFRGSTS